MAVMVVTGAGRGIGAAIARLAGEGGWDVAVNYSRSKERAEAVAGEIRAKGRKALAIQGDVGSEPDVLRLFETVDSELGPPAALVNNAAIDHEALIVDFEAAGLERVWRVNVLGPWLCSREAVRRMSRSRGGAGGAIVNISSISARTGGLPKDAIYTTTKGALDSFTLALGKELGPEGIRAVSLRPGITRTEIFDHVEGGIERVNEIARTSTHIGRIAEPEEVAALAVWLCSDAASYVTSTIWDVSGGR